MKLKRGAFSIDSSTDTFGRRNKAQDTVRIDAEIKSALDEFGEGGERRTAFLRLLACVRAHTVFLRPNAGYGCPGWVAPVFLINRLRNLARRQAFWLRPCETWRPADSNQRPAFRSLAQHLLARYPVPGFMDSVWDLSDGPAGFRGQSWYIRLGRGVSFRTLNLPIALTRRMEHHVRHAPDHYTVTEALRFGEMRGLGAHEPLAREVSNGRLGESLEHPDFWRTVLRFLVAQPEMKLPHVNPIIDFIQAHKFGREEVTTGNGTEIRRAPCPEFSIKGRTSNSILRLVLTWHSELAMTRHGQDFAWEKSGIEGYRFCERRPGEVSDRDWSIHELLESAALRAEGRALRHCVFSYADRCRLGETTIWSLRLRVNDQEKRMATIEVHPRRRAIVQMRAKCNLKPGERSLEIIAQWAASVGLKFDLRA